MASLGTVTFPYCVLTNTDKTRVIDNTIIPERNYDKVVDVGGHERIITVMGEARGVNRASQIRDIVALKTQGTLDFIRGDGLGTLTGALIGLEVELDHTKFQRVQYSCEVAVFDNPNVGGEDSTVDPDPEAATVFIFGSGRLGTDYLA